MDITIWYDDFSHFNPCRGPFQTHAGDCFKYYKLLYAVLLKSYLASYNHSEFLCGSHILILITFDMYKVSTVQTSNIPVPNQAAWHEIKCDTLSRYIFHIGYVFIFLQRLCYSRVLCIFYSKSSMNFHQRRMNYHSPCHEL